MGIEKREPKVPVTVRISSKLHEELKSAATESERTVSEIINEAIDDYMSGVSNPDNEYYFTSEEIERILPVMQAIGKPVSMSLFLQIIKIQEVKE